MIFFKIKSFTTQLKIDIIIIYNDEYEITNKLWIVDLHCDDLHSDDLHCSVKSGHFTGNMICNQTEAAVMSCVEGCCQLPCQSLASEQCAEIRCNNQDASPMSHYIKLHAIHMSCVVSLRIKTEKQFPLD